MNVQYLASLSVLLLIASCSGLSESECVANDWEQVGFEDGEDGKDVSQIETYRKSCARHDAAIDETAYADGHREGVRTFCTAENGFKLGTRGYEYTGICPVDLEGEFLREHSVGYEFYYVYRDIDELEIAIARNEDTIERLEADIDRGNFDIDGGGLSDFERIRLQRSVRNMDDQMQQYKALVRDLETLLFNRRNDLQYLEDLYAR